MGLLVGFANLARNDEKNTTHEVDSQKLCLNENDEKVVLFDNLVITCDSKTGKTSVMVDGNEFGHRCNSFNFSVESGEDPQIRLSTILRLSPNK